MPTSRQLMREPAAPPTMAPPNTPAAIMAATGARGPPKMRPGMDTLEAKDADPSLKSHDVGLTVAAVAVEAAPAAPMAPAAPAAVMWGIMEGQVDISVV